jgi:hypothetical protein
MSVKATDLLERDSIRQMESGVSRSNSILREAAMRRLHLVESGNPLPFPEPFHLCSDLLDNSCNVISGVRWRVGIYDGLPIWPSERMKG